MFETVPVDWFARACESSQQFLAAPTGVRMQKEIRGIVSQSRAVPNGPLQKGRNRKVIN